MTPRTVREQIAGPAGAIECAVDRPATPPRGLAIVCHPHPQFGGTLDNKVVQTIARACLELGWASVRFNFRGVGASEGAWDEGRGEVDDALAVLSAWRGRDEFAGLPFLLAGFSFGGYRRGRGGAPPAPPSRSRAGSCWSARRPRSSRSPTCRPTRSSSTARVDDVVPLAATLAWARPQHLPVIVFPGVGHFFHGQLGAAEKSRSCVNCTISPRSDRRVAASLPSLLLDPVPMRLSRFFVARLVAAFLLGVACAAFAQAPQPPEVAAKSYIVLDLTTHQTLAERDADALGRPGVADQADDRLRRLPGAARQEADARADAAGLQARLERAEGRRLADVHRHDDDAEGRRAAARADRAERQRRGGGAGRRRRRQRRRVRRHDEPAGAGLGPEEHRVQERHRPDRARPPQHGARPGRRSRRTSSATSPSTSRTTRSRTTSTTTSPSRTATCCCAATRRSTA